jgi:hypothetical protein
MDNVASGRLLPTRFSEMVANFIQRGLVAERYLEATRATNYWQYWREHAARCEAQESSGR